MGSLTIQRRELLINQRQKMSLDQGCDSLRARLSVKSRRMLSPMGTE